MTVREGAEGGDFRGQFCYAGMLAAMDEGIGRIVAVRMVSQMIGCPFRAGVLERPAPRHQ